MTARVSLAFIVALGLTGCDRIEGLLGTSDDAKSEAAKSDDAKPDDAKPDDAKPDDAKPDDAKPEEAKSDETGPDEAAPIVEPTTVAPDIAKTTTPPAADDGDGPTLEEIDAPAAAGAPCIVGHWEATDYLAQIDRALRQDPQLKGMSYKSKSGTIGYVVEPVTDGKAIVRAKASDLSYQYAGKVQGIGVSLGITMSGEIVSSYELAEPSRIVIAKPTENTMKVKASVKLKGLGSKRDSSKVKHQFDGDFPYECTDTDLTVWTDGRDKRPLKFKRLED